MKKHGINKGTSSDNPDRVRKNNNMRDRSTINRIHMYREGKAKHDRDGKVIGGFLRSKDKTANVVIDGPARIAPTEMVWQHENYYSRKTRHVSRGNGENCE